MRPRVVSDLLMWIPSYSKEKVDCFCCFLSFNFSLGTLECAVTFWEGASYVGSDTLRSDPARSTIFNRLYLGLRSLSVLKNLIWNTWWLLDEWLLTPFFANTRFSDESFIEPRKSFKSFTTRQVWPCNCITLFLSVIRSIILSEKRSRTSSQ